MATALDEILEFYENEKLALETLINELVLEREFKQAHIRQKALKKVNHTLFLLRNLKNPNHAELTQLQQSLEDLKKLDNGNPAMKDFFERRMQPIKLRIQQLEVEVATDQLDSQEFDDVIFELVAGKIKHFHFFINTKTKLYLDFKLNEQSIIIELPRIKKLKNNFTLPKSSIAALKGMGFQRNKDENTMCLSFDVSNFKDANPIKTIVSRVIYEGFGHHHTENSSVIVIIA